MPFTKIILFFICVVPAYMATAQSTDFILLKRKKITQATYFVGSNLQCTTTSGAFISGQIVAIKNDSIVIKQYDIRQVPTQLGVYILDTVNTYYFKINYKQIKAIGTPGRKFNWSASGASLMSGSIVIAIASGIVALVDNKRFSPNLLIGGVALGGLGYLLYKNGSKGIVIGKKYALVYVNAISIKK
jgi:hypothetical protein